MPEQVRPHIAIDTNILVYCALATQDKHDLGLIEKLREALKTDKARLLVPEIVQLEYERKQREEMKSCNEQAQRVKQAVDKIDVPTYLATPKQQFIQQLDKL